MKTTGSIRTLAKETNDVSRNDAYTVNPRVIKVDWESNPRKDYGSDEEFNELMDSIKLEGVKMPITGYVSADGSVILTHGFRRMKAVLALIEQGVDIVGVPFRVGTANMESILLDHLTLNSGKPLSDIEIAETLVSLMNFMGREDYSALAKRVGMNYQKVYRLVNFAKNASSQVKDAVLSGVLSITAAIELVSNSESTIDQNATITELKDTAKATGKTKISTKSVAKSKGKVLNKFEHLLELVGEAEDNDFTQRLKLVLDAVESNRNKTAIIKLMSSVN